MKISGLLLAGALASSSRAAASPPVGGAAKVLELRQSTQAPLGAVTLGEVSVWKQSIDDQAIQVDESDGVHTEDELLFERAGRPARYFKAMLSDASYKPGQPLTRRIFLRDARGASTGFMDQREGRDLLWRRTRDPA